MAGGRGAPRRLGLQPDAPETPASAAGLAPGLFLLSPLPVLWLVVVNLLTLFLGALGWVHPAGAWTPERRELLVGTTVGLHVLITALLAFHLRDLLRQPGGTMRSRALLAGVTLLFAPPVPYLFLAGFSLLEKTTASRTLSRRLSEDSATASHHAGWLEVEERVRQGQPRPALEDRPQPSPSEHARLRLYDLVALALGLDAAALGWGAALLLRWRPEWEDRVAAVAFGTVLAALTVAGLALVVAAVHRLTAMLEMGGALRLSIAILTPAWCSRPRPCSGSGSSSASAWRRPARL